MDGPRGDHTKSDRERQLHMKLPICEIYKNGTDELIHKKENYRYRKQTYSYQRGK